MKELSPRPTSRFQPSAARIHPVLKKVFIISSASNQLVITDTNGNVENVYMLAKKLFPQAEGLTFKSNGDMYISNEALSSKASLLKFTYIQYQLISISQALLLSRLFVLYIFFSMR